MPSLCRDCMTAFDEGRRCPSCGSPRVASHPELFTLSIAHMDCDAFYASVEKRDNPDLLDKPVIIGGGKRGVVSTACYIARMKGVRSAMPMFQATKLCPEGVIVRPRMNVYAEVSRAVKEMMLALTPSVEPLSLDEAFLDLTGTERLHHAPPAVLLARLTRRMEVELGITGSIGLSHNKFLAKVASDLDKPRGFSLIGKAETEAFLKDRPVGLIWGIGPAAQASLERDGIRTFADVRAREKTDLMKRFGTLGERLWHLSRGEDYRRVSPNAPVKSISNETTFFEDTASADILDGHIWRLAEKVADRAKAKDRAGSVVTLKLKRADHSVISRQQRLRDPTQVADKIYAVARGLFDALGDAGPYRLLGVGLSHIVDDAGADPYDDLLDPGSAARAKAEKATDAIRAKFGGEAILKGRALR